MEKQIDKIETGKNGGTLGDRVRSLRLPPPQPSRSGSRFAWFLCLCLAVAVCFLGYREWDRTRKPGSAELKKTEPSDSKTSPAPKGDSPAKSGASTGAPSKQNPIALEAKGYIVAKHLITLSPKVGGMVQDLFFEEGQAVKKGEVIAILESDEYRFERDRAKANFDQAKAKYDELVAGYEPEEKEEIAAETDEMAAQAKQLELAYKRAAELRKSVSASAGEVEEAEASWKAMASRLRKMQSRKKLIDRGYRAEKIAAAKAEVDQAKAELERTQWRLDNCTIRAPVNGVILSKKSERGSMVNPIAPQGSFSICEIADLTDLEVDLTIQERDFSRIFDGQKCLIRPDAWPNREYKGVARRMPMGDRSKGAVPVRVTIEVPEDEAGEFLRPEMGAVVSFLADK